MLHPPCASRSDDWFSPGRYSLILALAVVAAFPGVFFWGQTFYYSDFASYGFPLAHFFRESFWHGAVPLWNPLSNCGLPFLAQWNTQVLYPPALFYLLFPLAHAFGLFCMLHLFRGSD